ncbi:MAG: hypothetical protein ACO1N9_01155 [Flavobacterium sp.]
MERDDESEQGKISPEDAMRMLKSEGIIIDIEQAAEILFLLRKIANIAVSKYLERWKG